MADGSAGRCKTWMGSWKRFHGPRAPVHRGHHEKTNQVAPAVAHQVTRCHRRTARCSGSYSPGQMDAAGNDAGASGPSPRFRRRHRVLKILVSRRAHRSNSGRAKLTAIEGAPRVVLRTSLASRFTGREEHVSEIDKSSQTPALLQQAASEIPAVSNYPDAFRNVQATHRLEISQRRPQQISDSGLA